MDDSQNKCQEKPSEGLEYNSQYAEKYPYHTNEYKIYNPPPKPVGYWILDPGAFCTKFGQYRKPHRIQIWFTEKLLGWQWEDAK